MKRTALAIAVLVRCPSGAMEAKGFVRVDGTWLSREEAALIASQRQAEVQVRWNAMDRFLSLTNTIASSSRTPLSLP